MLYGTLSPTSGIASSTVSSVVLRSDEVDASWTSYIIVPSASREPVTVCTTALVLQRAVQLAMAAVLAQLSGSQLAVESTAKENGAERRLVGVGTPTRVSCFGKPVASSVTSVLHV